MPSKDLLMLLDHCVACEGGCCHGKDCDAAKSVVDHLDECPHNTARAHCSVTGCRLVRMLIVHWASCPSKTTCKFCKGLHAKRKRDASYFRFMCLLS